MKYYKFLNRLSGFGGDTFNFTAFFTFAVILYVKFFGPSGSSRAFIMLFGLVGSILFSLIMKFKFGGRENWIVLAIRAAFSPSGTYSMHERPKRKDTRKNRLNKKRGIDDFYI